jgi:hypothetical protein
MMVKKQTQEKGKLKVASYSISEAVDDRIQLIREELFPQKTIAEVLEEIFKTLNSKVFKKWDSVVMAKFVARIGSVRFSSRSKKSWEKCLEENLNDDNERFWELVELLALDFRDTKLFAWECQNIVKSNKGQSHEKYNKKVRTFNLSDRALGHLNKIQLMLGENKSTSFQFAVLVYYYLTVPSARYQEAKRLYALYEKIYDLLRDLYVVAGETMAEIDGLIYPNGSMAAVCEKRVAEMDTVSIENCISECSIEPFSRMLELEPILNQIDAASQGEKL